MASSAETSGQEAPRSVTDPALLPSILPRIRRIAKLLQEIRHASEQEAEPDKMDTDDVEPAAAPEPTSSLALGAIADDEDMDMWMHTETSTNTSRIPANLLAQLARETNALRTTFVQTQAAIDAAPGGDMSVAEQEALLAQLQAYAEQQSAVRQVWANALPELAPDAEMPQAT